MKTTTNATDKKNEEYEENKNTKQKMFWKEWLKVASHHQHQYIVRMYSVFLYFCVCTCWCLYMYFVCLRVYIWTGTLNQESNSSQNWLQCYKVLVISLFLLLLLLLSWSVCCASDILMTIIFNDINSENFMIQFHNNTHHH